MADALVIRHTLHGDKAVKAWLARVGMKTLYIEPGSP